jgi:hypothetical protein
MSIVTTERENEPIDLYAVSGTSPGTAAESRLVRPADLLNPQNGLTKAQAVDLATKLNSHEPAINRGEVSSPESPFGAWDTAMNRGYIIWSNGICVRQNDGSVFHVPFRSTEVTPDAIFTSKRAALRAIALSRRIIGMSRRRTWDAYCGFLAFGSIEVIPLKKCTDCSKLTFDPPFRKISKCYSCRTGYQRYNTSPRGHERNRRYEHGERARARKRKHLDSQIQERELRRWNRGLWALRFRRMRREGKSRAEALAGMPLSNVHFADGSQDVSTSVQTRQLRRYK